MKIPYTFLWPYNRQSIKKMIDKALTVKGNRKKAVFIMCLPSVQQDDLVLVTTL